MTDYIVDILMPAYNHELYIEDALIGVVSQKTDFKFRLLIADDCSKDTTRDIIEKYRSRYPEVIFPFYRSKNLGAFENSKLLFKEVRSKYVALCEGDDYWTDNQKLQKQVDILENNMSFVACCSDAEERFEHKLTRNYLRKDIIEFDDLANGNLIYTCTAVYRNIFSVPSWFEQCKMGDWIIWLTLTQKGSIFNIQEPMAVYRIHNRGIWFAKGKEQNLKDILISYNVFMREFDRSYVRKLKAGAKQYYNQLLDLLSSNGSKETFEWTMKAFREYHDVKQFRYILRYWRNKILPSRSMLSGSNQSSASQ